VGLVQPDKCFLEVNIERDISIFLNIWIKRLIVSVLLIDLKLVFVTIKALLGEITYTKTIR